MIWKLYNTAFVLLPLPPPSNSEIQILKTLSKLLKVVPSSLPGDTSGSQIWIKVRSESCANLGCPYPCVPSPNVQMYLPPFNLEKELMTSSLSSFGGDIHNATWLSQLWTGDYFWHLVSSAHSAVLRAGPQVQRTSQPHWPISGRFFPLPPALSLFKINVLTQTPSMSCWPCFGLYLPSPSLLHNLVLPVLKVPATTPLCLVHSGQHLGSKPSRKLRVTLSSLSRLLSRDHNLLLNCFMGMFCLLKLGSKLLHGKHL